MKKKDCKRLLSWSFGLLGNIVMWRKFRKGLNENFQQVVRQCFDYFLAFDHANPRSAECVTVHLNGLFKRPRSTH